MPAPKTPSAFAPRRGPVDSAGPALNSAAFRRRVDCGWRAFFARRGIAVGSHTFSRTTLRNLRTTT